MTDNQALFTYRLQQATETLRDAEKMLQNDLTPRSVINRTYYAMFYAVLALFISEDINPKTSKHSGVIAVFDKEFVHTGKLDRRLSRMLHSMFDARQESDYKELAESSAEEAVESVKKASEFVGTIKSFIGEKTSL
jgi:uncharacterized protein (UPF0332 family)